MSDIEVTIEFPEKVDGDWLLRCRTDRFQPRLERGDWLIIKNAETAEPGQVVAVEVDGLIGLAEYEDGLAIRGVVAGLYRRLT